MANYTVNIIIGTEGTTKQNYQLNPVMEDLTDSYKNIRKKNQIFSKSTKKLQTPQNYYLIALGCLTNKQKELQLNHLLTKAAFPTARKITPHIEPYEESNEQPAKSNRTELLQKY